MAALHIRHIVPIFMVIALLMAAQLPAYAEGFHTVIPAPWPAQPSNPVLLPVLI